MMMMMLVVFVFVPFCSFLAHHSESYRVDTENSQRSGTQTPSSLPNHNSSTHTHTTDRAADHIMVVRLRFQRFGRTHTPFYRMVAANHKAPRDGKFLEVVGTYNPIATRGGTKEIRLKTDRLRYWLSVGAQPSDRVAWILGKFGVLPPKPVRYNPQKMVPRKDQAAPDDKKKK